MNTSTQLIILLISCVNFFSRNANVYACNSTWNVIPGRLNQITASINYFWGVTNKGAIYMCPRPFTGGWRCISGNLAQVDASDEEVWGVYRGSIWKRRVDSGDYNWINVGGSLKHVSASGNGYIWGVNANDDIYKCKKPCKGAWVHVEGKLKQIDGGQEDVYGVNSNNDIYTRPEDGSGSWRQIPGKLKYVTASGIYEVFGVDPNDHLWHCKKPCNGNWEIMPGVLKQIDAAFQEIVGVTEGGIIKSYKLEY